VILTITNFMSAAPALQAEVPLKEPSCYVERYVQVGLDMGGMRPASCALQYAPPAPKMM